MSSYIHIQFEAVLITSAVTLALVFGRGSVHR